MKHIGIIDLEGEKVEGEGGLAEKLLLLLTAIGPRGGDAEMLDKQDSINHQTNFTSLSYAKKREHAQSTYHATNANFRNGCFTKCLDFGAEEVFRPFWRPTTTRMGSNALCNGDHCSSSSLSSSQWSQC